MNVLRKFSARVCAVAERSRRDRPQACLSGRGPGADTAGRPGESDESPVLKK